MLLKDVTDARADYDKALALADALAEADPQNATARRFQSLSAEATSALKELETVIPLLETIVEANSQDAKSRRRVANATTMLGSARLAAGQPAEARQAWQRSRELTLVMIDEGMRVEQMQLDLAEIDSLISSISE